MKRSLNILVSAFTAGLLLVMTVGCSSQDPTSASLIPLKAGEVISFAQNISGGAENGWSSTPDSGGTWSDSDNAKLDFEYQEKYERGLKLAIVMRSFTNEKNPLVKLSLSANGEPLDEINFDKDNFEGEYTFEISPEILSKNPGKINLDFRILNAAVPNDLGLSADLRKLGIFLIQITPTSM